MNKKILISALGVLFLFAYSCNKKTEKKEQAQNSCENVKWGYKAPQNWGDLCTGFAECNGDEQSPVNIETNSVVNAESATPLNFSYDKTGVNIVNTGHGIKFNVSGDNTLTIGNKTYKLLQFHYHTQSEHTINGTHFPMEVHFVHKGENGLAVVGMLFTKGNSNPLLENYLTSFPKEVGGKYEAQKTIPLKTLLPQNLEYYHYDGSLTTPPCSEIVEWYVLKNPITASEQQLEQMLEIMHKNNRPVQKLNGRKIELN